MDTHTLTTSTYNPSSSEPLAEQEPILVSDPWLTNSSRGRFFATLAAAAAFIGTEIGEVLA